MIPKSAVLIFTLLLGAFFSSAREPVSLEMAIRHALKHKAEAVKAGLDVENSEYQIDEVRAAALPQLNGQAGLTYNPILQQMALNMGGQTTVIEMGLPWQSTATVQLDQQIFNMSVFQGLKAARSTREFYKLNRELTEEQIIEKVANAYFEVFKTRSQIETINSTITNTTRVRDVIAGLYENGLSKKIDLDRMNVSLNNLTSSRQQLENAAILQENALKYLIGMDIHTSIELEASSFEVNPALSLEKPDSLTQRTEIRLLEKQGELLSYNKKAINAQRYPSLALSANYGYMGLGSRLPYFTGGSPEVNWSDFSAISLNLRIPIFSGFSNRSKVQQARIEIEKYKADLEDTRLALDLAVENALTQIRNALITLQTQSENRRLAQSVLENVENNYKNGLASLTDLLDAENAYADARNNYTNALMDYKLAEIQLVKARGELKIYYLPAAS